MFGISCSLISSIAGNGIPPFTPATLALTGWWQGSYSGAPWVGTASAGSTYNMITAGSDPTSTTAVNGYNPALFTAASSQYLTSTPNNDTIFSASAGSVWILFYANSASAPVADFADGCFFDDTNNPTISFGFTTAGIGGMIYDGGSYIRMNIACSIGAWHLAQWKWDGVNLYGRIDNGVWSSIPCSPWVLTTQNPMELGKGFSFFFDGMMLDIGASNTTISDADFDNIYMYCNARYGLAL